MTYNYTVHDIMSKEWDFKFQAVAALDSFPKINYHGLFKITTNCHILHNNLLKNVNFIRNGKLFPL